MLRVIIFIVVLFLLLFLGVSLYQNHTSMTPITVPLATPTPRSEGQPSISSTGTSQQSFCLPSDLQAAVTTDAAAGNIYGSLTIKNISNKSCQINGDHFIQPTYTAPNITITQQGQPGQSMLLLSSGQTVYSRVHYPNGPQCNGPTTTGAIAFHYQISQTDTIGFKNSNGATNQMITLCISPSQQTDVQVWSITDQPTNQ